MSAWIKVFNDGTREVGTDESIRQNKASWSRGKLNDIKSVQIFEGQFGIRFTVEDTEWHQFDRFVSFLGQIGDQCNRVFRCIQAQIKQKHIGKYIIINKIEPVYLISLGDMETNFKITKEYIGKWISCAILPSGKITIAISDKGRI